ncbi:hypothetical protein SAY87_029660 [Trapa incisa]|uniref:DNA2/NAM7 helicase helicase domain-containing protein n=2 Tax=Trapa TaxID=22665 RepID=A0AAN7Q915_9MYRT|nr:hypothetical protein SAY87_029660 [Trapa incisa]
MASRGRPLFDLNEPPTREDEGNDGIACSLPQKALPLANVHPSTVLAASALSQGLLNNNAFSHASSVSVFQPFIHNMENSSESTEPEQKRFEEQDRSVGSLSKTSEEEARPHARFVSDVVDSLVEREEGEWSDGEGQTSAKGPCSLHQEGKSVQQDPDSLHGEGKCEQVSGYYHEEGEVLGGEEVTGNRENTNGRISHHARANNINETFTGVDFKNNDSTSNNGLNMEVVAKQDSYVNVKEEPNTCLKPREVKGVEANYALKCANNLGKRKIDQQKEAMLGKKRSRQTMFLNLEDVKQAASMKSITPRRNFSSSATTRSVREVPGPLPAERISEKPNQLPFRDQKRADALSSEAGPSIEKGFGRTDFNGDPDAGLLGKPRRLGNDVDILSGVSLAPIPRQNSWKNPSDTRMQKHSQVSNKKLGSTNQYSVDSKLGSKKHILSKKQNAINNTSYQDTSVERFIREVTNEKFWHHPGETELQCVPGSFGSVEEYVRVFEPLLFEECRAQLYSTWEELNETFSRDTHVLVHVRNVERRERGWYDVVVLPSAEIKWSFKEGDVAVLSTPKPGPFRSKRNSFSTENGYGHEISGRVAGTIRRFIPLDTRDPPGAILHFYVGDSYNYNGEGSNDHILRKLQAKCAWYLTVLGSLATTQREYVALHAFRHLNTQMQLSILQPSPEHFPDYEQHAPTMPDCFTPSFVEHINRSFNGPQLAAIQWAAMHTAAGTNSGTAKRQEPWPFTLVQGPPGTGKTHTVWGMLNVIHLVQYQHYYNSLLKKLAPESYKQSNESSSDNKSTGSIDDVLQSMDQSLFRTLPKLCPKPRMLVCAPSNAATDELLARVLDRGFIDGEMRIYRPDVARVGIDSQTRAAQAVSVERRTEQLLAMSKEEVYAWLHRLRNNEAQFSHEIAEIQMMLNSAAAAIRSQGSVAVDPDVLMARDQARDAFLKQLAQVVENRDKVLVEMSRILIVEARFRAVMGNANALIQSDDWAALIDDAKARKCYMDMDSLPKDFLASKGAAYTPLPGKSSFGARGQRSAGTRHRVTDLQQEGQDHR